jgi:hypothetical protein
METKNMTTKKVLLALAASSLFAFGSVAPVWAEDPPPPANDGATMPVPPDPDSAEAGDIAPPDPGTDEGAGDAAGGDAGTEGGEPPPEPQ